MKKGELNVRLKHARKRLEQRRNKPLAKHGNETFRTEQWYDAHDPYDLSKAKEGK